MEEIIERVMKSFQASKAVKERFSGRTVSTGRPGSEVKDLSVDLRDEGVRSGSRKADGSDVKCLPLRLWLVWEGERSAKASNHFCSHGVCENELKCKGLYKELAEQ
jgi:hypothetical protein